MIYFIIYKTTNLVNGKQYTGCHKTNNIDDGYLGSGKLLKRAIKKYGVENFVKEILYIFDNIEEMFETEKELVNEKYIEDKMTYNLKLGGESGWHFVNSNSLNIYPNNTKHLTPEYTANALRIHLEKLKTDTSYRTAFREARINYITINGNPFKGKKHTERAKCTIGHKNSVHQKGKGNSQYNTIWITNGELNKKINKNDTIPVGWWRGRKIHKR